MAPPSPVQSSVPATITQTPAYYEISIIPNLNRATVIPAESQEPHDQQALPQKTIQAVLALFQATKAHPDRLVYALAGKLFHPTSPIPFGGTRSAPGYILYKGTTTDSLITFIITETYRMTWIIMNRIVLDFVSGQINAVLEMQCWGSKDELDELMMKGMKRAGHVEWFGAHYIPPRLRHVGETNHIPYSIEFCVGRLGKGGC
ncbi:hypothetical protein BDR26DRAFT_856013 [Obelidium mucronatum]|nr:hypothetical protein BDR26DRAFT_856013 [Obelidium mucronatum]